jgi:hypothetical protein
MVSGMKENHFLIHTRNHIYDLPSITGFIKLKNKNKVKSYAKQHFFNDRLHICWWYQKLTLSTDIIAILDFRNTLHDAIIFSQISILGSGYSSVVEQLPNLGKCFEAT